MGKRTIGHSGPEEQSVRGLVGTGDQWEQRTDKRNSENRGTVGKKDQMNSGPTGSVGTED